MSARRAAVPGSFDPVTLGHLDVIRRATLVADEVRVAVVHNPAKKPMIPVADRMRLIEDAIASAGIEGVVVDEVGDGLLVDYCRRVDATLLVKGLRSQTDVAYETPMALVNRDLADVETVFVLPDPARSYVSSSLVRQVHSLGGDVTPYVPPEVATYLRGAAA